ncbi:MAG: hypothetical protein FWE72_04160 [Spirochaetaceae bacterium]|nr:hypothetical protein [Spirochaetaceae bacterium]
MRNLGIPLTKKTADLSDRENFSFSFFCDCCEREWISPSIPFSFGKFSSIKHEETMKLIWAWEHQLAFEQANLEAHFHFNNCSECNNWVCNVCFAPEKEDPQGHCNGCSEKREKINIFPAKKR